MELRSCTHLHFIQALKGGLPVKTLNVARGRPVLKFKKLIDISETLDAKNGDSFPAIPPKDEFRGLFMDRDWVMGESTRNCTVRNITIKTEREDSGFNSSDNNDGRDYLDGFGNMTLKQIKETCKSKKRKRSKSVDLNKKLEMCYPVKQEYSELQTDEEDCDLIEPLSNWKVKLSKKANAKTKSKRVKNCVSTMSQSAILTTKLEHIPSQLETLQFSRDVPTPVLDIKVEVPETDSSDFQNTTCFLGNTSLACDNQVGSCEVMPNELPETAADCVSRTGLPISLTKESQICGVDEDWYEDMEYDNPTPIQILTTSGWDIIKADDPEITSYQCFDFPLLEYNIEGYITDSVHPDVFIEAISSSQDHNFDTHDTLSSEDERLYQTNSETQVQMSNMAVDDSFQCRGPINGTDGCLPEADNRADVTSNVEASASSISDCGLGSGSCLVSAAADSPMAEEEKQSQTFPCAVAERNLSPGIFSSDANDELTTLVNGGSPDLKQQRPPQRLFQTRKIISPASQEKLCKAMKSIELQDEDISKMHRTCKGNLCFGKQAENTIGGAGGLDQIRRAIKTQNNRNPKYEKIHSHPKGIPKGSNVSAAAPRFSTGCTSIRACSESAIAFSQRQMHDIECLATKLSNELKTMKEIAEERLQREAYPATSLRYNANEARMALKNVTRVEASARRLLSMMSRDCNRFCKIMKLADNGSNASENVANKEKKITFADEAGEKLCHVKFFENDRASFPGIDGDQEQEFLLK
ncbi:unnamed protein product [Prunus armeniaca]|uniref:Uncharacterized protein n=1 Tax=Prunus armeniaca TaxID=36596 RepID=A0A6J5TTJ4_PRUAR|nr:hypothetical protein GBA52_001929 [Prunus armeniaca]CAB4265748.1 unnamed protein product [Prunus armeniaca]CAB4296337.1 unnamed protein product [Prunus armeniaca]